MVRSALLVRFFQLLASFEVIVDRLVKRRCEVGERLRVKPDDVIDPYDVADKKPILRIEIDAGETALVIQGIRSSIPNSERSGKGAKVTSRPLYTQEYSMVFCGTRARRAVERQLEL